MINWSLTKLTDNWKNTAGTHSVHFLIDFVVYKSYLLGALDASKNNVFGRITLTACRMMELLWNKPFDKKKKQKKDELRTN